ncbi:MAG TPA: hypothetical protein VHW60_22255 [Caulobacteraceae bacterium]|jgi:hypothetical protein|nr:hypothetical protein [Caulobacteraceae bacterium]
MTTKRQRESKSYKAAWQDCNRAWTELYQEGVSNAHSIGQESLERGRAEGVALARSLTEEVIKRLAADLGDQARYGVMAAFSDLQLNFEGQADQARAVEFDEPMAEACERLAALVSEGISDACANIWWEQNRSLEAERLRAQGIPEAEIDARASRYADEQRRAYDQAAQVRHPGRRAPGTRRSGPIYPPGADQ